jgi:hypothetical protein
LRAKPQRERFFARRGEGARGIAVDAQPAVDAEAAGLVGADILSRGGPLVARERNGSA